MASLILGLGALTYDKVKTSREKRRARKESNAARFAELERENAERMARLHPEMRVAQNTRDAQVSPRMLGERVRGSGESGEARRDTGGEGQRPPAYESLVAEGKGGKRGSRGFWKEGEGFVR